MIFNRLEQLLAELHKTLATFPAPEPTLLPAGTQQHTAAAVGLDT